MNRPESRDRLVELESNLIEQGERFKFFDKEGDIDAVKRTRNEIINLAEQVLEIDPKNHVLAQIPPEVVDIVMNLMAKKQNKELLESQNYEKQN